MKQTTQERAATVAPATDHQQALAQLRQDYASGRCGPQGLIALSNQYPDISITELTQLMREVKAERQAASHD